MWYGYAMPTEEEKPVSNVRDLPLSQAQRLNDNTVRLSDTADVFGLPITVDVTVHPPTHAYPGGIETRLAVGREAASLDATSDEGRRIIADLIASLSAALEFGENPERAIAEALAEAAPAAPVTDLFGSEG
jgi:hypothetical protein